MVLLASFSFLNLHLHEGPHPVLVAEWRGFVGSAFLRQAVSEALVLARQHHVQGWVADDRLLGPVRPVDLEWVTSTALPELIDMGVTRFAIVEAQDPLNRLLINNAADTATVSLPLEMRRFGDVAAACAWAGRQ